MSSPAQLAANRANSQYSAGPKTDEGKHRISLNAYKHGLTGQIHLLTDDEQQAFDTHCKGICEALQPVGALELDLAQSIAENRWRLQRARAIESGIFALGLQGAFGALCTPPREDPSDLPIDEAFNHAKTWVAKAENLQLLALYEQRINRTIERNMAELRTLRAERQAVLQQALEEAQLLAQVAKSKGERYDAAADFPAGLMGIGSEFSPTAINLLIARNQRLTEAREYLKKPVKMSAA